MRTKQQKRDAILWCLLHQPGMRGRDLSEITGVSYWSIYRLLGDMEAAGMVKRVEVWDVSENGFQAPSKYFAVVRG